MKRHEIMDKLEGIENQCFKRNTGSNEAELEFKEEIADWIYALEQNATRSVRVAVIGSDCIGVGKSSLTEALLKKLDVVGKVELVEINENNTLSTGHTMNELRVDEMILTRKVVDLPFSPPEKKPHHDKNVRRHARKSQW
ncbi:hypothetical protein BZG01_00075 [Labilibaculum manganireducens]|uniref:Uncharacterized protein n=1 Tax=Labilibaculum manganireducens TaxID=1940525 RepID=A0A2N3IGC0_9BACT|nr:hypothetical protein [Labilibaculum manganireducens]PKQ69369.1 hypothetical protein BZG01_00075 [Labilibaculum manganireducens]